MSKRQRQTLSSVRHFRDVPAEAFDTVLLRKAAQAGKQGKPMAEVSAVLGRVKEAKLGKSGAPVPRGSQRLMPGSHSMRGGKRMLAGDRKGLAKAVIVDRENRRGGASAERVAFPGATSRGGKK
jgi:hypothetical protein